VLFSAILRENKRGNKGEISEEKLKDIRRLEREIAS
jgi:hypothetical protein